VGDVHPTVCISKTTPNDGLLFFYTLHQEHNLEVTSCQFFFPRLPEDISSVILPFLPFLRTPASLRPLDFLPFHPDEENFA